MKRVIVFDLDDTLYSEIEYVKSGFKAVSKFLHNEFQVPYQDALSRMIKEEASGRGSIFNNVLKYYDIYSLKRVKQCISIYRLHKPDIALDQEAKECFKVLKEFPKYVVTDGNKIVQGSKVNQLGLNKVMKHCFVTHRHGILNAKPSPYCFLKICERESVDPQNVAYIGDNPKKDFVGIKPYGFRTVRILRGPYKDLLIDKVYDADFKIRFLRELDLNFIQKIFTN